MEPLTMALGAALLYGGYKAFFEKPAAAAGGKLRFVGDLAKPGDEVQVSVNNLSQINKNLPVLPPNTAFVLLRVDAINPDPIDPNGVLSGPIVSFGNVRIPAAVGNFIAHRVLVDKVIRAGKQATSITGPGASFTGDPSFGGRPFQG